MHQLKTGTLYIVPTPIGNLLDITYRGLEILKNVDLIVAENIQHTNILLQKFNITNHLVLMNKDNENQKSDNLIKKLQAGVSIALVSNAGTPVINDPGFILVKKCYFFNIKVIPLPGACAAITALSASGLANNRFCYEGFLPSKKTARCNLLLSLKNETRTIIFYESKYRILQSMEDIIDQIDKNRYMVIAREITKKWESIHRDKAHLMLKWLKEDKCRYKGELVIIIEGFKKILKHNVSKKVWDTFCLLRDVLSLKKSVTLTAKIHQVSKNNLYQYAIKKDSDNT